MAVELINVNKDVHMCHVGLVKDHGDHLVNQPGK